MSNTKISVEETYAVKKVAIDYLNNGLSVIPIVRGEKRPSIASWKSYQNKPMEESDVERLFEDNSNIAIVCGEVSGGLEVIDFDPVDGLDLVNIFEKWMSSLPEGLFGKLVVEESPRKGYHIYYRTSIGEGNQKLAETKINGKKKAFIETRAEGGYIVCHPSERYTLLQGSLVEIPTLSDEERETMINVCRMMTQVPPKEHSLPKKKVTKAGLRVGKKYNTEGDITDLLESEGWTLVNTDENVQYWRRPGKTDGISATFNHIPNIFYVFSTNADPFESETAYTPFMVYALLKCDGDYTKAASELKDIGYDVDNVELVENYLSEHYDMYASEITELIHFKQKGADEYSVLNDNALNTIYNNMRKSGLKVRKETLRNVVESDYVRKVDEIKCYFDTFKIGDTQRDYIKELADTVVLKSEDDRELFAITLKKWMVSCIATQYHSEFTNQICLILAGPQGSYKTTWLNKLIPPQLKPFLAINNSAGNEKDTLMMMSEYFIINLDELATFKKQDIETLKSQLTQRFVRFRKPYSRYLFDYKRRANFVGSINDPEFLSDHTGSRRFLIFEVLECVVKHNVDINVAWAQAKTLYDNGYPYYFTKEDIELINKRNERFTYKFLEDEIISSYISFPDDEFGDEAEWLSAIEIANRIAQSTYITMTNIKINRFGKKLSQVAMKKTVNGTNRYFVKINFG